MRRAGALLALLAGWLAVAVGVAGPALAHAELVSTNPADGARLDRAPAEVSLTFSESVGIDVGFVRVVNARGARVDTGAAEHPGGRSAVVRVGLRPGLGPDSYLVSYRVVSADSHPIAGAVAFVVGDGPLVSASGAVTDSGSAGWSVRGLLALNRWVSFVGLVLLGGTVLLVTCWPAGRAERRARRLVWTGWALTAGAALSGLLLQGPYAAGEGVSGVLSPDLLGATLSSTLGRMVSIRLVALGVLAVLLTRILAQRGAQPDLQPDARHGVRQGSQDGVRPRVRLGDRPDSQPRRLAAEASETGSDGLPDRPDDRGQARNEDLATIAGLVVLATYAASGHAVAGIQPSLAVLSDTVHLGAMSAWVGGLVLLTTCLLPAARPAELALVLPRFSQLAFGSVAAIVLTGSYQTWREVGTPAAVLSTGYGRLLLVKVAGFVVLLVLGDVARRAIRRRYRMPLAHALSHPAVEPGGSAAHGPPPKQGADGDPMVRRLRASVAIEFAVAAVVLALTAVLVGLAPARASYVRPVQTSAELAAGGRVTVLVTPARAGANVVRLTVLAAGGAPARPQQVTLSAALPDQQIGPLPVRLVNTGTGRYESAGLSLPGSGTWQLVVRVRTSEFDTSVAKVAVPVR